MLRAVYASNTRRALKLAIHLLILTMVRKSELIEARWSEFDLDAGIWRIPADRMKKDEEHWVYLSSQAVAMLRELFEQTGNHEHAFPTTRGRGDQPLPRARSIRRCARSASTSCVRGPAIGSSSLLNFLASKFSKLNCS
nr:tyrosine-type recombinase/integrase [Burkholderia ubonensis]